MQAIDRQCANIFTAAIANKYIRSAAMDLIHSRLRERTVGGNSGSCPEGVKEEKYYTIRNLLNSADRALSNGNISPAVRRGLFQSLLKNTLLEKGRARKDLFYENHGIKPPGFLTVSPTRACNLNCKGCYAGSSEAVGEKLSFNVFDRIISEKTESWGSYFTVISGGEPLMYRDKGRDIFEIFNRHRDNFFLMYTNGTLVDEKTAARLSRAGNVTPAISVEGGEAETDARRGKDTHRKILRAFEALRQEGVPFGISLTATRENADIVTDENLLKYYIEEQGALYAWIFQYMPIGRSSSLDLLVTPEQRVNMLKRTRKMIREKGYFIADFWNSGPVSYGCMSAGRRDGYLYITWNGDITPCVFVPYSSDNINDIYAEGKSLDDVLFTPFFKSIRQWQDDYLSRGGSDEMGNLVRPCPFRDHYADMRSFIDGSKPKPIDEDAKASLKDEDYYRGLKEYGEQIGNLTEDIWRNEYLKA